MDADYKVQAIRGMQVEFHPGFGPAEVTWDDGTVSIYPGPDLKVTGKIRPVTG